jgi:hypothetical protein
MAVNASSRGACPAPTKEVSKIHSTESLILLLLPMLLVQLALEEGSQRSGL